MEREKTEAMAKDARAELATAKNVVAYWTQVVNGLEGLLRASGFASSPPSAPRGARSETDGASGPTIRRTIFELPGQGAEDASAAYPRTPDAVLTVLQSNPNHAMGFAHIWDELNRRGLVDPSIKSGRNAYQVSATRLVENANVPVVRNKDGDFVFLTMSPSEWLDSELARADAKDSAPAEAEASTP